MKQPPDLFPKIPYTRQRGRLSNPVERGEDFPYTGRELTRIRAQLLKQGGKADCPRCKQRLEVGGPIALRRGGNLMWAVRCQACRKHANIRVQSLARPAALSNAGLVVSDPPARSVESRLPEAAVAVGAHVGVLALLLVVTAPRPEPVSVSQDTSVVFLSAPNKVQPRTLPLPPPPAAMDLKIQGFQTSVAPISVPDEIPQADPNTSFDPRDFSGVGVEGEQFSGIFGDGSGEYDPNRIWPSSALPGEPPRLLASPPLIYPPWMQNLGIEGYVVLQFVIDTAGKVEPKTLRVMSATHEDFIEPATRIVLESLYIPARVRGKPVRVLTQIRVNFNLTDGALF
ncbi:MAG: energy transducer TonB [Gemmatimonadota bacterium]|nr:MAG: energy transducer TonB [Gemmatimonadota bacterium]